MTDTLSIDFENDKVLTFSDDSNPRNGFTVTFGDLDEKFTETLSKDDRIDLIKFLVQSL